MLVCGCVEGTTPLPAIEGAELARIRAGLRTA